MTGGQNKGNPSLDNCATSHRFFGLRLTLIASLGLSRVGARNKSTGQMGACRRTAQARPSGTSGFGGAFPRKDATHQPGL